MTLFEILDLNACEIPMSDGKSSSYIFSLKSLSAYFFGALWSDFTGCFEKYFNHSAKAVLAVLLRDLELEGCV